MSLTAHPYVVLAEQQWKQQSLGHANLAPRRPSRTRIRLRSVLGLALTGLHVQRHDARHRARPV
ncbi:hypothetical protein GCM10009867_01680 [Pedococcus aerophilus]|uniref:Uncharacterized protein n=1 Tax=Pedococcus aerophilus TaxID=436356 RepID=A0ABN3UCP5_9MICO